MLPGNGKVASSSVKVSLSKTIHLSCSAPDELAVAMDG